MTIGGFVMLYIFFNVSNDICFISYLVLFWQLIYVDPMQKNAI